MTTLKTGDFIDISRSDGRVHRAMVSRINYADKLIDVVWQENGAELCKPISFADFETLNSNRVLADGQNLQKIPSSVNNRSRKSTSVLNFQRALVHPNTSFTKPSKNLVLASSSKPKPIVRSQSTVGSGANKTTPSHQRNGSVTSIHERKEQVAGTPPSAYREHAKLIEIYRRDNRTNSLDDLTPAVFASSGVHPRITVFVKKRPLLTSEQRRGDIDIVTLLSPNRLVIHEPKAKLDTTKYLENRVFDFDGIFDGNVSNEVVTKHAVQPLVEAVLNGSPATLFCYGETGSGKTHTLSGAYSQKTSENQDYGTGLYALAAKELFLQAGDKNCPLSNVEMQMSFFEIYNDKLFDLLGERNRLSLREDESKKVQITELLSFTVVSLQHVIDLIKVGLAYRSVAKMPANPNSSRSHAILRFTVIDLNTNRIHSTLSLVDLAGNERNHEPTVTMAKTARDEAADINSSLFVLKECMRAMSQSGPGRIPFRNSPLTMVLRDSFIEGNSKICMIANICPNLIHCHSTLNTLLYAQLLKCQTAEETSCCRDDESKEDRFKAIEETALAVYDDYRRQIGGHVEEMKHFYKLSKNPNYEPADFIDGSLQAIEKEMARLKLLSENLQNFGEARRLKIEHKSK